MPIAKKMAKSKVIEVITEFYPLNARPEPIVDNLALEQKIGLVKEGSKSVSIKAILSELLHPMLICLYKVEQK